MRLAEFQCVRSRIDAMVDFVVPTSHEALDRVNGTSGVGHRLTLGRLADEDFALVGESDHARRQAIAFRVGDDLHFTPFHDRDDRVGRTEVDPDDFAHGSSCGLRTSSV